MKVVYIAHRVSGDIPGNTAKVLAILKKFHTDSILPIAPYLTCLDYLDDSVPEDRKKGMLANEEYFKRGFIEELWVCSEVSKGVRAEIDLAEELGIPVKHIK